MSKKMTNTEAGAARLTLCRDMAAALTAATGETWLESPLAYHRDAWTELSDPAGYRGARYIRQSDGFTVRVVENGSWNQREKGCAQIDWPDDPTESGCYQGRRLRDADGWAYDAPDPAVGFTVTRPAKAVAAQILRGLVKPEYAAAWASITALNAAALAEKDKAGHWRDLVGAAHGQGFRFSESSGAWHGPSRYSSWAEIELKSAKWPGGSLTLNLPEDPEAAGAMVARLRAVVEGAGE